MGGMNFIENLLQDVRYGARMLLHSPGFAITAVLALALGIGANTAIFTVVNKVLLEPLAYPEPDRLVQLELSDPQGNANVTSIPKFNVWREQTKVFEAVTAYDEGGPGVNLTGGDRPQQLRGIRASADYFRVFGTPMEIGRAYTEKEDRPGGPKLAVLANGLWKSQFGSDPKIVGKTIELGGDPYVVTGVLGAAFHSDQPVDVILPLEADPNSNDQSHYLLSTARLRPSVTVAMAKAAMNVAAEEFRRKFPGAMGSEQLQGFTAVPLREAEVGDARLSLLVLLGAVSFVLLIACANVANLLLVRATIRRREIAIRAALGAGRRRIISQLLTESVLLSLAGGVVGLVLGYFGVRALLAMNPGNIPRIGEHGADVTMDWRVLGFTLLVSVLTGILFGLIPALSASRSDLSITLRESGSRSGSGLRQNKARSLLVVTEMALALILLVGAALLIRTFAALRNVNPGFSTHNVLTMNMSVTGPRFEKTAGVAQLVEDARQRVEAVPGVEVMATTCCLPLEGGLGLPFTIEGRPRTQGPYDGGGGYDIVSPEYFAVFRIPLIRGRMFTVHDNGGAPGVVLISETMAKKFWPKGDAVGAQITIGKGVGPEFAEPPREIVGIVGDARNGGLDRDPYPIMYIPVAQVPNGVTALNARITPLQFVIQTKVEPFSVSTEIQKALREASGGLPVGHVRSMDQVESETTARSDFNMTLLTIFAAVALLLAAIGIYGLMAYSVQQRTQEIGIRMALGAGPKNVRRMVVLQGMRLVLAGVVIGVGAALALSRYMASLVFGVKTWNPAVFVTVVVVLSAVAWAAAYVPSLRASRVDPMVALRYE
ncbi:MAG TPA: ABC transporter permease [Candidatus Acidoferrales bacterium]|nr:ABC transporter permease [Candidatus Acidoferrales bacterium]